MSFNSKSIKQLQQFSQQLPEELHTLREVPRMPRQHTNKHPVEEEENPELLFQELINISPDGKVPSHLIQRLKELEKKKEIADNPPTSSQKKQEKVPNSSSKKKGSLWKPKSKEEIEDERLYCSFERLLLEELDN